MLSLFSRFLSFSWCRRQLLLRKGYAITAISIRRKYKEIRQHKLASGWGSDPLSLLVTWVSVQFSLYGSITPIQLTILTTHDTFESHIWELLPFTPFFGGWVPTLHPTKLVSYWIEPCSSSWEVNLQGLNTTPVTTQLARAATKQHSIVISV